MARRWTSKDIELTSRGRAQAKVAPRSAPLTLKARVYEGRVLGIDPSLRGTGLALIEVKAGRPTLLFSQTIKTKGTATEALGQIAQSIENVCRQYTPDAAAIEDTIYAQNQKTAITLGSARGAALATLSLHQISCQGYAPSRIKQAVVGSGRASKPQVAAMVQRLLAHTAALPSDEADAAATALCYIFSQRTF
jgi:crossover junction endodeoxyribonuclease RuvC